MWAHDEALLRTFVVVTGPSAGGKTTLVNSLRRATDRFWLLTRHTDRSIRPGEVPDIDYYFVTTQWFASALASNIIVAYAHRFGSQYALAIDEVRKAPMTADLLLVVLDFDCALQFKTVYQNSKVIFVGPNSVGELIQRHLERGANASEIKVRLRYAERELSSRTKCDVDLVNPAHTEKLVDETLAVLTRSNLFKP